MIRPLRRRHRVVTVSLALVVPALFAAGLAVRTPSTPAMDELPAALLHQEPELPELVLDRDDLWQGLDLPTRIGRGAEGAVIEIGIEGGLGKPDVLLYWSEERPSAGSLPEGAYLVGVLVGNGPTRLRLPDLAIERGGHLLLYSLGHQELLSSAELPRELARAE